MRAGPSAVAPREGQEEATVNKQICGFLTVTDMEDAEKHGATQSFVQVDLVGCEHTELSLDEKFFHNQPQTTIGNKQTARLQVTDIRFAKKGKDRQNALKARIRGGRNVGDVTGVL